MDWLKSTNPVINWVACSLDLTVGVKLHTVLALPLNSIANVLEFLVLPYGLTNFPSTF